MFTQIIKNTPPWVWGLLLGLIALGWSQAVARRASLKRVLVLPTVMSGLSLAGLMSAFGVAPGACAAWLLGALAAAALVLPARLPAATVWDAQARQFQLPAGWTPMLLILGIFFTKYGVGVALALQPGLAQSGTFSQLVSGLYGAFSGIFLARAARLWRLSRRPELAQRLLTPASARISWPKRAAIILAALIPIPVLLAGLIGLGGTQAPPVASAMGKVMSDRVYQDLPELSYYAARDGARLAQLPLLPRPNDEPRVAVLVHGSPGDSHAVHAVARAPQVQGLGAYALDMRGHGASGPCCHLAYVGQIDDDLADFTAPLRARQARARAGCAPLALQLMPRRTSFVSLRLVANQAGT